MSDNFSSSPQTDQSRIDQSTDGNFGGAKQAIYGDSNSQTINDNRKFTFNFTSPYPDLRDSDFPKPLTFPFNVFNYVGVIFFLVATLASWIMFGGFSKFPFPYWEVIDLISCCFKGNIASAVNNSQLKFQLEHVSSRSLEDLNRSEIQASVYLGILERLGSNSIESNERIAKTIEVLKSRRRRISEAIQPIQTDKYKRVKDRLEYISLSVVDRDLERIEKIIDDVTQLVVKSQLSDHVMEDTADWLSRKVLKGSEKISPSRLGVLYRIQHLIKEISSKQISKLSESELSDYQKIIIDKLQKEANGLKKKLSNLDDLYSKSKSNLEKLSSQISQLNSQANREASAIASLESQIQEKRGIMGSQVQQIESLALKLNDANRRLIDFKQQQSKYDQEILRFRNVMISKDSEIEKLQEKVAGFGEYKLLNGEYLGILPAKRGSSYHFHRKCPDWKMLVGEYVLNLDSSRQVSSHNNPQYFIHCGLKECEVCGKKSSRE